MRLGWAPALRLGRAKCPPVDSTCIEPAPVCVLQILYIRLSAVYVVFFVYVIVYVVYFVYVTVCDGLLHRLPYSYSPSLRALVRHTISNYI